MKKILSWLDQNALFILSLFLLIFIPLYPKLPLADIIPGYLVRVRLEDILVFTTGLVWFIQVLRKKIIWKNSFNYLILIYAGVGLVSLLVATLLQQTIPLQLLHIGKSLLHYFRYLEYFSLFLFMYAGINNQRQVKIVFTALVVILNLIFIYGFGQRYLQWPAFSTMNREYSKGQSLVLSSGIKLHSTFGGHYDLAAYLVIVLPLITAWLLRSKTKLIKFWLGLTALTGLWLLLESASKTALAACLVAVGGVIWFSLYQKWGIVKASLVSLGTGLALGIAGLVGLWLFKKPSLYKLAPFLRPTGYETPVDVETALDETWSENARKYGLSMGIRLDTLWPNALDGFTTNPYTGKGYATLNKEGINEFTEADSTDNNFLRVLGETGLLGTITFFGIIILILKTLFLKLPEDKLNQSLVVGFIAATLGLFINAFIIDVFAASKVAFSYWALAGLTLKSFALKYPALIKKKENQRLTKTLNFLKLNWPILITSVIFILLVHKRPFTEYSLVKSFAINTPQAKYVATTKCLVEKQSINYCLNQYQPKLGLIYSLYLLPFYLLYQQPAIFYFANLLLMVESVILINHLIQKITPTKLSEFLILLMIFVTPALYQLPIQASPFNLYLLVLLWLINRIPKPKPLKDTAFIHLILIILTIAHLFILQTMTGLTSSILSSWRDTYRPSNFVAIRRGNDYLSTRASEDKPQPILLNAIEPVLFDLYQTTDFKPQPILLDQLNTYQQLLTSNPDQELFITNANVAQHESSLTAFESYKHQFGIILKEIDCRHECNYYQLSNKEIVIPPQPQAWNQYLLKDQSSTTLLVINNQVVNELGQHQQLTLKQQQIKTNLLSQNPDLMFIVGDADDDIEKNAGQSFINKMNLNFHQPIISVLSNYNLEENEAFGPQYQRFSINDSWFVSLDDALHHHSPEQNRFIYDTLLQLEKHQEVNQIFFISNSNDWLKQHPNNYYFHEDFAKRLAEFPQVKFYFIFGTYQDQTDLDQLTVANLANAEFIFPQKDEKDEIIHHNSYIKLDLSVGNTQWSALDLL